MAPLARRRRSKFGSAGFEECGLWDTSKVELGQQGFEVGAVHADFLLGHGRRFGLVESLQEPHFGDGVLLGSGQLTAVPLLPIVERVPPNEDAHEKNRAAISRYQVDVFGAGS